jgi:hypothetical protein
MSENTLKKQLVWVHVTLEGPPISPRRYRVGALRCQPAQDFQSWLGDAINDYFIKHPLRHESLPSVNFALIYGYCNGRDLVPSAHQTGAPGMMPN